MMVAYSGADATRFPSLFEQMYRQRYEIYVKRRKWKALRPVDGQERDQFDHDEAVYLLAMDEAEDIVASLRLLPTTRPHILGDLFPHLSGERVPRGEDIYELTRFYVAPADLGRETRNWLIGVLSAGMMEYCLERGIRQVTSVIDTFLLKLMLSMEWPVRPLGLPQRYPEGQAVAVLVDVTERALESTRRSKGVEGPVLAGLEPFQTRVPAALLNRPVAARARAN